MDKYLLALDIGNTNIVLALLQEGKIINTFRLSSNKTRTIDECYYDFLLFCKQILLKKAMLKILLFRRLFLFW